MLRMLAKSTFLLSLFLLATPRAALGQQDPTRQWAVCYGPQTMGRLPPPKTVYLTAVSTATRVSARTDSLLKAAFRAFTLGKYGLDFAPRCDWSSSAEAAERQVRSFASGRASAVIATGWTWTQPAWDTVQSGPAVQPPGALEH